MPMPLRCKCDESNWIIHPAKIVCGNKYCHFTEHFLPHESLMDVIFRMKEQGCYYLDKDRNKCIDNAPLIALTGNYR